MSSQSDRVNQLIQEHSTLRKPEAGSQDEQREQDARVTQIRQELVQIFHTRSGK